MADKIAKEEGRTRSEVFREAIRAYFWKRRWEVIQTYGAKKAKEMGIKTDEDIERIIGRPPAAAKEAMSFEL